LFSASRLYRLFRSIAFAIYLILLLVVRTSSLYECNVIAAVVGATLVSMVAEIASEIDMGVLTASTTTNGNKGRTICIISKEAGLKSGLHPPTIAKVRFSTFNYEIGQHRPSNFQNRANLAPSWF